MSAHPLLELPVPESLSQRLQALVRPEFRVDVLIPRPGDRILGSPPCAVPACDRSSNRQGLCTPHGRRWDLAGRPDRQPWVAAEDPTVLGRRPLQSCAAPGCRFGQLRHRLCYRHSRSWTRDGEPNIESWLTGLDPADRPGGGAECAITGCELLAELDQGWCRSHHTRWLGRGRPSKVEFMAYCADYGEDRFDFRLLPAQLRLEIQYVLQCRVDDYRARATPKMIEPLLGLLADSGAVSLLDRPLEQWLAASGANTGQTSSTRAFLRYAIESLQDVHDGSGWDSEYHRDVWRLRRLGSVAGHSARLDFRSVHPRWLRELTKRWCRWRMSCDIGLSQLRKDLTALTRLSQLTAALAGSVNAAVLDRAALEDYLARLALAVPHPKSRSGEISAVNGFLRATRQHRWAPGLPARAELYPSDHPRRNEMSAPRAIPEFVMAQIESAVNLDRLTDHRIRLLVEVLIGTGLRINDATTLARDCLIRDRQGATYLRYRNHKMRREAMVPIDDGLTSMIRAQQDRTGLQHPNAAVLIPRENANPDGRLPIHSGTFDLRLKQWLDQCRIVDELGRPAKVTAHRFRHTYATRMINNEVPQEVVRRLLDHVSHTMTAQYARLADTTIRQQWERAQKINVRGEPIRLDPDGPMADAAWLKENLARAKMALPNGYCGLPLQKTCPHANACLTCPLFVTTAEFLPQHHQQLDSTRLLIAQAEDKGQRRMVEMNRDVETNLLTIINALENGPDRHCCNASDKRCGCERRSPDAG